MSGVACAGIVQVISEPSYATPMDVPYEGEITEHTYVLHIDGRRDQFVILDPGQASLEGLRTGQYVTVSTCLGMMTLEQGIGAQSQSA